MFYLSQFFIQTLGPTQMRTNSNKETNKEKQYWFNIQMTSAVCTSGVPSEKEKKQTFLLNSHSDTDRVIALLVFKTNAST